MSNRGKRRFCVEAVFTDGARVAIRDFHLVRSALSCKQVLLGWNLYPDRDYHLEVNERYFCDDEPKLKRPSR